MLQITVAALMSVTVGALMTEAEWDDSSRNIQVRFSVSATGRFTAVALLLHQHTSYLTAQHIPKLTKQSTNVPLAAARITAGLSDKKRAAGSWQSLQLQQ